MAPVWPQCFPPTRRNLDRDPRPGSHGPWGAAKVAFALSVAAATEEKRAAEHYRKLFDWVVNCTEEDSPVFEQMSVVADPRQVRQPLDPVGTEKEYRGVAINKLSTDAMAESLRGFFSYQRPNVTPSVISATATATDLDHKPGWVLFEHGTYVVISEPGPEPLRQEEYRTQAVRLLQEYGPVLMGTQAADVAMVKVKPEVHNGAKGWIVFGEYPVLGTFVGEGELEGITHEEGDEALVAFYGREKRHLDSKQLGVVHEEPRTDISSL